MFSLYSSKIYAIYTVCWSLDDIITISKNTRRNVAVETLSPQTAEAVYAWSAVDTHLYNYFKLKFQAKLRSYGHVRMAEKVAELKRAVAAEEKRCEISEVFSIKDQRALRVLYSPESNIQFGLNPGVKLTAPSIRMLNDDRCVRLTQFEVPFTEELKYYHRVRLAFKQC